MHVAVLCAAVRVVPAIECQLQQRALGGRRVEARRRTAGRHGAHERRRMHGTREIRDVAQRERGPVRKRVEVERGVPSARRTRSMSFAAAAVE